MFFGLKRQVTTSLANPMILITNIYRKPTPTLSASFFAPRPRREGLVPHNYNNIERNEIIPSILTGNTPAHLGSNAFRAATGGTKASVAKVPET